MGYSPKWLEENLGITRYMIRYYEEKELIPKRKKNQIHDYSEEDIEKIWAIKLLIGIGFSAEEIYSCINNPEFEFDVAIAEKVKKLEQKCKEKMLCLQFAKTIKLTGRIPTVKKVGTTNFDDFIAYARENWNCYNDPQTAQWAETVDKLAHKNREELSYDEIKQLAGLFEKIEMKEMICVGTLNGYYKVIINMKDFGYNNEMVQKVVDLIYNHILDNNIAPEDRGKFTPQYFARYIGSSFIAGDIAVSQEKIYGKEGCMFIAEAIAYYAGLKIEEL